MTFEISHIFIHNSELPGFKITFEELDQFELGFLPLCYFFVLSSALQLNEICFLQY